VTAAELAALEALVAAEKARQTAAAVGTAGHDNRTETDGGAPEEENPMCRIKLYRDKDRERERWRVRITDTETGKVTNRVYTSEQEAKAAIPKLKREYQRPVGVTLGRALEEYRGHLTARGNRPRSIDTTLIRIRSLLAGFEGVTGELTQDGVRAAWGRFLTTPGARSGKLPSVDTQVGVLKQTRTFVRWLAKRGYVKTDDLLTDIEVTGTRKQGKPQFTGLDESRCFLTKALELARAGDKGAIAAATALLLGMRASEIADRLVRELDDGGKILVITSAKTRAGIRRLQVPAVLQPLLVGFAKDRAATERLFGPEANRHWVLRAVGKCCKAAGVPVLTPHGLRGTHATLAVAAGMSGPLVASSLGHESFAITQRHYASEDSVTGVRIDRVADALNESDSGGELGTVPTLSPPKIELHDID